MGATVFVGREHELSLLCDRVDAAGGGTGTVTVVEGAAGIGKTALVDALVARHPSTQVLRAAADDLGRHHPFDCLGRAFGCRRSSADPRRQHVADVLTTTRTTREDPFGSARVPFAVLDAFLDLFEALAADSPCLLVVEDVHWADEASIVTLASLARRAPELPVAVVLTTRPGATGDAQRLLDLLRRERAAFLDLVPLSPAECVDLVRQRLGGHPGARLRQQLDRLDGNPLHVVELLDAGVAEGVIQRNEGTVELVSSTLPVTFRALVLNRLSSVAPVTVEVLRAAAVLGSTFGLDDLTALTGRSRLKLVAPIEEARAVGVLAAAGEHLAFRHDLVRQAIYEDLPAAVRRTLHEEAMEALAAGGAPADRIVPHAAAAATVDGARWLQRAAADVGMHAPASAVTLCEAALEILGRSAEPRDTLQLAEALLAAGRAREAGRLAADAAEDAEPAIAARAGRVRFRSLVASGQFGAALELARDAASSAAEPHDRADALVMRAGLSNMVGDSGTARVDAAAALALAEAHEIPQVRWWSLAFLGWASQRTHGLAEAERLIRQAADLAGDEDGLPHAYLGLVLLSLDRMDEADAALRRARDIHEHDGQLFLAGVAATGVVGHRYLRGWWDDAVTEAESSLSFCDEFGLQIGTVICRAVLATIACHRGDVEAAQRQVTLADEVLETTGPQSGMDLLAWAKGCIDEARGEPDAALDSFTAAWSIATTFRSLGLAPERAYAPTIVRLALDLGRVDIATSVRDDVLQTDDDELPGMEAAQHHVRGLVDDDPTQLVAAVERYRQSPRTLDHALGARDAALALARHGEKEAARRAGATALALLDDLGASGSAARAAAGFRSAGLRFGATGGRDRPAVGWDSLTPAEVRVAELVAEALTNAEIARRLFVSHHTVETHVRHIYRKVGLSTRTELAIAAADRYRR